MRTIQAGYPQTERTHKLGGLRRVVEYRDLASPPLAILLSDVLAVCQRCDVEPFGMLTTQIAHDWFDPRDDAIRWVLDLRDGEPCSRCGLPTFRVPETSGAYGCDCAPG